MFKALRGVVGLSRVPMRIQAESEHQAHHIQRVRLGTKWWRPKRFAVHAVGVGVTVLIFDHIVLGGLDKAAEKIDNQLTDKEKKEIDEMELPPWFIPFPLTTKEIQPSPYKGSDPEWQEFLKFSKDPAMGKHVREELANIVKAVCERHPLIVMRAGKTASVRRTWLDIDFPTSPPPEFLRSGIQIGDDFIGWGTQPVESEVVNRTQKVLWPVGPAIASFSFCKVLVTNAISNVLISFGFEPLQQPSLEAMLARHAATAKQIQEMRKPGSTAETPHSATKETMGAATTRDLAKAPGDEPAAPTLTAAERQQKALAAHFHSPIQAFKMKFLGSLKSTPTIPPRGSLFVSGMVELDCPKAWIVMDIRAAWNPKTNEFDKKSMVVKMRRMQMKRQPPPGGH